MLGKVTVEEKRKVVYDAWVDFFIDRYKDLKPVELDCMSLAMIQVKTAEIEGMLDKQYKLVMKTMPKQKTSLWKKFIKFIKFWK